LIRWHCSQPRQFRDQQIGRVVQFLHATQAIGTDLQMRGDLLELTGISSAKSHIKQQLRIGALSQVCACGRIGM
jgi:hypothetical protein